MLVVVYMASSRRLSVALSSKEMLAMLDGAPNVNQEDFKNKLSSNAATGLEASGESLLNLPGVARGLDNIFVVNFIGSLLALSALVAFAMIMSLSDAVSSFWCEVHGLSIYFCAGLTSIYLLALAVALWLFESQRVKTKQRGSRPSGPGSTAFSSESSTSDKSANAAIEKAGTDSHFETSSEPSSGTGSFRDSAGAVNDNAASESSLKMLWSTMKPSDPLVQRSIYRSLLLLDRWAPALMALNTMVVFVFGEFEQESLFCFVYRPHFLVVVFYFAPIIAMAVLAVFFIVAAGILLNHKRRGTVQSYYEKESLESTESSPYQTESSSNADFAKQEYAFLDLDASEQDFVAPNDLTQKQNRSDIDHSLPPSSSVQTSAAASGTLGTPPVARAMKKLTRQFSRAADSSMLLNSLKPKLLVVLFVFTISGLIYVSITLAAINDYQSGTYYQGKEVLAALASDDKTKNQVVRESEVGIAVFILSAAGILVFSVIGTDPHLWEIVDGL